jgi:beta-lactam-binding protein with PASTA domain
VQLEGSPLDPAAGTTGLVNAITAFSNSPQNASGATASGTLLTFLANPPASYTVGGTISNLSGTLGLDDNGFDPFTVTSTGTSTAFTFPTPIAVGSDYSVTVTSQPTGQACTVSNGSGTMGIEPVTTVAISCTAARIPLPDVTRLSKTNAENTLTAVGLVVGTELQAFNDTVPEGQVISQNPAPGPNVTVAYGSTVNLVISLGPQAATIPVPGVVGLTKADAEAAITAASLHVGTETLGFDRTVPIGSVISQNCTVGSIIQGCPVGTLVPPDTVVNLVISNGPAFVNIPDLSGRTEADAEQVLINANLVVGTITPGSTLSTRIGRVMGQSATTPSGDPVTCITLPCPANEGDIVNLVINSLAPDFSAGQTQSQAAAEAQIQSLGLVVGTETQESSATVPAGIVISQDPAAGAPVTFGSTINLVISGP